MIENQPLQPSTRFVLLALLVSFLCACTSVEDKRIRQLLNEKGFGTRAQGNATLENYVTGGDAVQFLIDPAMVQIAGAEQLALLTTTQSVALDGTIYIPYVGPVWVLGMTETDLSELVSSTLQPFFTFNVRVVARILPSLTAGEFGGKAFYMFGEAGRKGRVPLLKTDLTVLEALGTYGVTNLANIGRVHLIRPDAQNPLDVVINYREIVLTGNTTYNLLIQDNDIIYVPPTFFGVLARFLQRLLEPLGVAVQALFGVSSVRSSYEYAVTGTGTPAQYPYGRF